MFGNPFLDFLNCHPPVIGAEKIMQDFLSRFQIYLAADQLGMDRNPIECPPGAYLPQTSAERPRSD